MKPVFLVLVELMEEAERATRYAARIAGPAKAELVLLHVEAPPVEEPRYGMMMGPAPYREQGPDLLEPLTELAQQLGVFTTVEIATGALSQVLPEVVARNQPKLLVIGLSAVQDWLDYALRRQVLATLQHTRLPILLVPTTSPQLPGQPQRVVLAVDNEPFQVDNQVQTLLLQFGIWNAAYTLVHVTTPPASAPAELSAAQTMLRASGLLPAEVPVYSYAMQHPSRAAGILQAAADTQADMLVLVARPRSFFGELFHQSVTMAVARRTTLPLLLLPASEENQVVTPVTTSRAALAPR